VAEQALGHAWFVLPYPTLRELRRTESDSTENFAIAGELKRTKDDYHPADLLLFECLDLFDKCEGAKTLEQQALPMKMYIVFAHISNCPQPFCVA
jgi:hypothetical protein